MQNIGTQQNLEPLCSKWRKNMSLCPGIYWSWSYLSKQGWINSVIQTVSSVKVSINKNDKANLYNMGLFVRRSCHWVVSWMSLQAIWCHPYPIDFIDFANCVDPCSCSILNPQLGEGGLNGSMGYCAHSTCSHRWWQRFPYSQEARVAVHWLHWEGF